MTDGTGQNNLLVMLHKRADRQDENFLTDAFAHLLRHLCHHEPESAVRLLQRLTDNRLVCSAEEAREAQVSTQVATVKGRPDLEIRTRDHLAYVEAKKESGLGDRQLSRYREQLRNSRVPNTSLVLLTRYLVDPPTKERPDVSCRWYQVATWIEDELHARALHDPVSIFLATQFVDFLRENNMTIEHIERDLIGGVRSLRSILAMIAKGIASQKGRGKLELTLDYAGFYVNDGRFFVGLYHKWPGFVFFETWKCRVRKDAAERAGFGEVELDREAPSKRTWTAELELSDESFFDLPREKQMDVVEQFLVKCFKAVPLVEETSK